MLTKIRVLILKHVKNNVHTYFLLSIAFIIGISAGAFTVNGLSSIQKNELSLYLKGFLQLLDPQNVDGGEIMQISILENAKLILLMWILGVTIIGIPFIYLIVGIRGFITGFSSGFIVETLGLKGVLFTIFAMLPKEVIIVPCVIALGVNGINFSLNIIKKKSIRHISKESLKTSFIAYSAFTAFLTVFIFCGILIEAYITPVFIRIIAPVITF